MKTTQLNKIKKILLETGEVSRNHALSIFISRLGAIICDLKSEGYEFITERRGGDYIYKLKDKPKVRKVIPEYDSKGNIIRVYETMI